MFFVRSVLILIRSNLYNFIILIMIFQKAKKKPLAVKAPSDFGVEVKPHIQVVSVEDPPVREAGQKVETVEELVTKLRDAGLIPSEYL